MKIFIGYLITINIVSYFLCWYDKLSAIKHKYRLSEKFLFGISAAGGAFGFYAAMYIFRHKTKHKHFVTGIPLLGIVWLITIAAVAIIMNH